MFNLECFQQDRVQNLRLSVFETCSTVQRLSQCGTSRVVDA